MFLGIIKEQFERSPFKDLFHTQEFDKQNIKIFHVGISWCSKLLRGMDGLLPNKEIILTQLGNFHGCMSLIWA